MAPILKACYWLGAEVSATRDEFRKAHYPGGDQLLDALMSKGLAWRKNDRYALTDAGRKAAGDAQDATANA